MEPALTLNIAQPGDRDIVLEWANEPDVRRASFQTRKIDAREHERWFAARTRDPESRIWILWENGVPCGMARVERVDGMVTLSYSVAASHRGKGLSVPLLQLALEELAKLWPGATVTAWTRPDNAASMRALEKACFKCDHVGENHAKFVIELNA